VIAGVVLAAGAGRRFGAGREPKQLAPLDGVPLLHHAVAAATAVPALERVVVVLGAHAGAVRAGVDLRGCEAVECPDWEEGAAASLRCGVAAVAGEAEAVVVTLGDQPLVTAQVIARFADLADEHGRAARARATYDGEPGHPIVLGASWFGDVARLRGDVGARDLLRSIGAFGVECGRLCSPADVDTPEHLEAIRS
jgi:CTP:molybdopterin cytidylyltransferase MocA